jgi:hypothetical protein
MMNAEQYFRQAETMNHRFGRIHPETDKRSVIPRIRPRWTQERLPSGCTLYRLVSIRSQIKLNADDRGQ